MTAVTGELRRPSKQQSKGSSGEKFVAHRQCLGVDVSKDKLSICFGEMDCHQKFRICGQKEVSNAIKGWNALLGYCEKFRKKQEGKLPFQVVMEATGVYYEGLAYFLRKQGIVLSVVLPNMSRNYARSLNLKSKNDQVEAQTLARMGVERKLWEWKGLNANMLTIKRLLRERQALIEQLNLVGNQRHAAKSSWEADAQTLSRLKKHEDFMTKQIKAIDEQVKSVYEVDADLKSRVENVCTIKGIGLQTALTVISETNGFELMDNKAQVVSYAGYDVVQNQSGTSVNGKSKISKKGNSHIRRALHFPALTAAKYEPKLKETYDRILERNPKTKMIAYVAIQRKLLVLIYTLYKNNVAYDSKYEENKKKAQEAEDSKKVGSA